MQDPMTMLTRLQGSWSGTCRTWFDPGKLADESAIEGVFRYLLPGRFLRHEYVATLQGKHRIGEETLIFNSVKKRFESTWFDSFHMNYGVMFSEGDATDDGFFVLGQYDVAPNTPPWKWRTVYQLVADDRLLITAFNVSPDGNEDKALETEYTPNTA